MNITNRDVSLLESVLTAQQTRQEIGVAVLKKAQAAANLEGQAAVRLIEQAGAPAAPPAPTDPTVRLDVYG